MSFPPAVMLLLYDATYTRCILYTCLHTVLLIRCQSAYLTQVVTQVVSSAIVDKYIGESARLIREMFGYAKEHQPCIIFMDEIDAIGGRRFSEGTSADREIQRTLMELLSQLDGFDVVGKVRKVLQCSLIKRERSCHLLQSTDLMLDLMCINE